ncbi:PAS domain-containing protein [Streptomyces sp. MUM 178J]|uniref:PAS domain-containing protein n=1 Tax=Streptomyces sp. MUM 178J TaxID=2791991 RepID=UPI001F04E770|nr:PAS domain-containing protein [Streptomyces sp. MUM 178J]WRQ78083.1 PAS domain-containing protein [Streptomyces sp. MUM 178J]
MDAHGFEADPGQGHALDRELADFVRRVGELRAARGLPTTELHTLLDAALFELEHVADDLWPAWRRRLAAQWPRAPHTPARASADRAEQQLFKALFQRLPLPVALIDADTAVRRMNVAATELTGVRAGYAAGRPLAGLLRPGDRAALRSQAAAVARGEGGRSLRVHLQQAPTTPLLVTLTALRPPNEQQPAVLLVLQTDGTRTAHPFPSPSAPVAGRGAARPDLTEATRHAELIDVLDAMTTALLLDGRGEPQQVLSTAARVLSAGFADWVVADLSSGGVLRRVCVRGPENGRGPESDRAADTLAKKVAAQDPADCPLVVETARGGPASLQVRPDDLESFGRDETGDSILVQADVTSLLCAPLHTPVAGGGRVDAVLTLFRTGPRLAFSLAEARIVDVMGHHIALAMRRRLS